MIFNEFEKKINSYLWAGYNIENGCPRWILENIKKKNDYSYSLKEAINIFDSVFDDIANKCNKQHIIPLSGGWDSRAILGAVIERFGAKSITTVTYGSQGQLDFEIGAAIARDAGVKNIVVDLQEMLFTWENIARAVKECPWVVIDGALFNSTCWEYADSNSTIWSGFLGGITGGGLLSDLSYRQLKDSQKAALFSSKQQFFKEFSLCHPSYSFEKALPKSTDNTFCDKYLYWYFMRQTNYIAPSLITRVQLEDWTPLISRDDGKQIALHFLNRRWANYWLNAPDEALKKQRLYLDILGSKFPRLFSLPSKYSFGMHPKKNYLLNLLKQIMQLESAYKINTHGSTYVQL
ncbi:hypothetical protein CHISP_1781 [Chitinispirillum alkaliphilum]|nr:hypothetical protein CHISP_1781 [Chitinispirillum alkaliphilum]